MERDFLGLNSNSMEPLHPVKKEVTEHETHWPFNKKASPFSQFISRRAAAGQDSGMNKVNSSFAANNHLMKPEFASSVHNVADAMARQQFLGIPVNVNSPIGQVTGFTEPWNNSNPVNAPAQMTIFYGGTVSAYNGITPEMAQAIMLLAGNGSFLGSNTSPPSHNRVQSHLVNVPPTGADRIHSINHPMISQSSRDAQFMTNTKTISSAPVSISDHQRVAASRGPVSVPTMVPSAVPQFRKASLARFLEKRKERVMSTGPYICEKKQEGIFPANNNVGLAANSGTSPAVM